MKLFAIYSKIHPTKTPEWLDAFYTKYTSSHGYHVTLKQSCFLEEEDIAEVKNNLSTFLKTILIPNHKIEVTFDKITFDTIQAEQKSILINAKHNPLLEKLQQGIVSALSQHKKYVSPESRTWEEHFNPHITIAADLNPTRYAQALKEIKEDYTCTGTIQNISLIIVDKMIPSEADRPENQTIYPLS